MPISSNVRIGIELHTPNPLYAQYRVFSSLATTMPSRRNREPKHLRL